MISEVIFRVMLDIVLHWCAYRAERHRGVIGHLYLSDPDRTQRSSADFRAQRGLDGSITVSNKETGFWNNIPDIIRWSGCANIRADVAPATSKLFRHHRTLTCKDSSATHVLPFSHLLPRAQDTLTVHTIRIVILPLS